MGEESRASQIVKTLYKIPQIKTMKFNFLEDKVFVYLTKDISEQLKNNIKELLHQLSDKYEVVFKVVEAVQEKKSLWQRFLDGWS